MKLNRKLKWTLIVFAIIVIIVFILLFVIFPIVFMNSLKLKQLVIFTNVNLPTDRDYFEHFNLTAYRNLYVTVEDHQQTNRFLSLGVWHILPLALVNKSENPNFNYDRALMYSNISVLLYFHGSGQARSYFQGKYDFFRRHFHVIAFDYRSFADSSSGELSEDLIVDDCLQLYDWLRNKTLSSIFIWGHSLGTAISAKTVALSPNKPRGLILEAPFTRLSDELYVHPVAKYFAWLPWFEATIVEPLKKAGFLFDTVQYLSNSTLPTMIINSKTDNVVAYKFGMELYQMVLNRSVCVLYYQFPIYLDYDHNYMYDDPSYSFIIGNFKQLASNSNTTFLFP